MKSSFEIGKIMGIPIKLHITFLLILPVFAWIFANNTQIGFGYMENSVLKYIYALSAAILLFVCVLLHEIGHSYVAKRYGTVIQNITLMIFGGVSSMEEIPKDPKVEFKMAFVGPLVSLSIGIACSLILYGMGVSIFHLPSAGIMPYLRLLWLLGYMNIILFGFNLLPAFPMDGGRMLRAWLAQHMSYIKATRNAASVGKMFAFFMALLGILAINLWLLLIAFFIYIGASEEEKLTEMSFALEGVNIRKIMSSEIIAVPPDLSVEALVNLMFEKKHMGYPVMKNGNLLGIVTFTDVQRVPVEERPRTSVETIMTRNVICINQNDIAVSALKIMNVYNIGRIIVKDDGKVVGIVSRTDLLRAIQLMS